MMYGWRARIGLIVPRANGTQEPEFYPLVPVSVSIQIARIKVSREATSDTLVRIKEGAIDVVEAVVWFNPI